MLDTKMYNTDTLMSFLSHICPAQSIVRPASSSVEWHEHEKHVFPARVALTHSPRPEHEYVEFAQTSAEEKHCDFECTNGTERLLSC